ncbi:MAG: archease [Acidobacteria bacterium]|jgi:SHS2 domain-containing protein|nr:archease [Acidobacteriota bacterium]
MRNYETFSTTADSGIRFQGGDFRELYGNALRALNLLLFGRNPRRGAGGEAVTFRFRGDGPENVLVNFLAAVLELAYRDGRRVSAVDFRHAGRRRLEARLQLAPRRGSPRVEVKSVTYHNLRVSEKNGVLRAAVVLDV